MTQWQKVFISALAKSPNVSAAARKARKTRQAAYVARAKDSRFAAAWDDALEQSTDQLVGEVYKRSLKGWKEPVYYKGKVCGHVVRFSNSLAAFLLKSHRRGVYGDDRPETTPGAWVELTAEAEHRAKDRKRERGETA